LDFKPRKYRERKAVGSELGKRPTKEETQSRSLQDFNQKKKKKNPSSSTGISSSPTGEFIITNDKALGFIMQPAGASMPRDSNDPSLSSKKPESRANKENDDRSEHQTTYEKDQETKNLKKDKKKNKEEFLQSTIHSGREDFTSNHPEYCEGGSENPNKGNEETSFKTKQDNESKVSWDKMVKRNKKLVKISTKPKYN
jgi:hypothetical protein